MTSSPCARTIPGANAFSHELPRQGLFTIPDSADAHVLCVEGSVWITQDNDPQDIVLQQCESFTGQDHRGAIVYALQPSRIVVTQVAAAPAPKSLVQRLMQKRFWPSLATQSQWN